MRDDSTADAIYVNGKIITVDRQFSIAEAIAVRSGRFVSVGTSAEIRKLCGASTSVIDLGGRPVLPGFIDTHAHTIFRGLVAAMEPSLTGLNSVAEILECIRRAAESAPPGAWIQTSPIGESPDYFHLPERLAERRWPTRTELDGAAPSNPVYIPTPIYWPHPALFNSAGLAALGVDRNTPDEQRVRIMKDPETGEPNGQIFGLNVYNPGSPLNKRLTTLLPREELTPSFIEGMRHAFAENVSAGVTTIYEGHANFFQAFVPELRKLRSVGRLGGRVVNAYEVPSFLPLQQIDAWMQQLTEAKGQGTGDDYFRVFGVTVSMDGPPQYGLALYQEPYLDPFGEMSNGQSAVSAEKLLEIARLAVKNDLRLNVLAAGDAAAEIAIQALEKIDRETPIRDRQWVAQHFHHPTRELIARIKALGLVVQTYSGTDYSKGAETYIKRFPGREIWKSVAPYRWWIDAGVVVTQASDGYQFDPMFNLWESLVRVDGRTGQSLLAAPKEISRREAIEIYTINGARLLQWEDRLGSIEPGKWADFVVLDQDILTIPVDQIRETKVVLTAIGGDVVHDSEADAP